MTRAIPVYLLNEFIVLRRLLVVVDVTEFEGFVAARGPGLTRYAYLLCGNTATAEDITQSALLKLFTRWERVSTLDDPVAYVRRVITREYLSIRRRKSSTEVITDTPRSPVSHRDPADAVAVRQELWQALRQLPPKQRAALVLRYYFDLPHSEVATLLGCSEGTARTHTSRGLTALRERSGDHFTGVNP